MTMQKRKCPICKNEVQEEKNPWQPFCSERCKTIDLGKWAMEDYRIPGDSAQKDSSEESEKTEKENDDVD